MFWYAAISLSLLPMLHIYLRFVFPPPSPVNRINICHINAWRHFYVLLQAAPSPFRKFRYMERFPLMSVLYCQQIWNSICILAFIFPVSFHTDEEIIPTTSPSMLNNMPVPCSSAGMSVAIAHSPSKMSPYNSMRWQRQDIPSLHIQIYFEAITASPAPLSFELPKTATLINPLSSSSTTCFPMPNTAIFLLLSIFQRCIEAFSIEIVTLMQKRLCRSNYRR